MSRSVIAGVLGSILLLAACESKRPTAPGAAAEQPAATVASAVAAHERGTGSGRLWEPLR